MPRHALVVAERRKRIFRPVAEILEVDEVDRWTRTIEGGAIVIAVGRAVLDLRRDAPDFERSIGQGLKGVRQAGVHALHEAVQVSKQVSASRVAIGIELRRRAAERRQPLADAALSVALAPEDRVERGADLRDLS